MPSVEAIIYFKCANTYEGKIKQPNARAGTFENRIQHRKGARLSIHLPG
ncbi:MAG TPA: hypothetical protein VKI61_19510 [Chitinophagaceae bacterium]|nr:hypothetical protein [Chitinophagaceae bacterium]